MLFESERYRLTSFPVKHRIACCGLKIEEHSLPWRLDGEKAKSARLPYHIRQQLKRGEETLFDGKILEPSRWCTPPPRARSYVFAADTRPCEKVLLASKNVTVLYHDATFVEAEKPRLLYPQLIPHSKGHRDFARSCSRPPSPMAMVECQLR